LTGIEQERKGYGDFGLKKPDTCGRIRLDENRLFWREPVKHDLTPLLM
jgi:hypothetical protein